VIFFERVVEVRDLRFRYVLKSPSGKIVTQVVSLEALEGGCLNYLINCEDFEVIAKDQFAGMSDMHGNEICEGDIIQLLNEDFETIKVVCEFGTARREILLNLVDITGFYFKRLCDDRKTFPIVKNYAGKHDLDLFEVVGNIHQNHDLLEGTK
jgi:uncharacterized phage protein (TIGR01671 family)